MIKYIGIDLGQKGAIAVQAKLPFKKPKLHLFPFFHRHDGTKKRPSTEDEVIEYLKEAVSGAGEVFVTIEHPIIIHGGAHQTSKKTVASLNKEFGLILGALSILEPTQIWTPTPQQWKRLTGFNGSDKKKMLQHAQRLFKHPLLDVDNSDSVLISEASRLHFKD